jgi:hypothetical protein
LPSKWETLSSIHSPTNKKGRGKRRRGREGVTEEGKEEGGKEERKERKEGTSFRQKTVILKTLTEEMTYLSF